MPSPSSSALQALQVLGLRLRELRIKAGFSGRDLGRLAGWHSSKVSKIEYGKQTPTPADIRAWCQHCDATEQAEDLIASLHAVEGMFIQWRRMERTGLRRAQEAVLPVWERTRNYRIYSPRMIPGPVQTPEYITTVLSSIQKRRELLDDVTDAVQARVDRQRLIHDRDRRFAILLEENVLRHPVGGPDAMAAQLGHLLIVGALPSISLGIIPLGVDRSFIRPAEGFWMFDDEQVAVELVSGYLTVTHPHEVSMYAQTFAELAALAVHGAASRALITAALAALDTEDDTTR